MGVAGIVDGVQQVVHHIGHVRDVVQVQLLHQVLLDEALDHVLGGDDHVIALRAGGQLGVHVLVLGEGDVVHVAAGLLLEDLQHFAVDVVFPVVDLDLRAGEGLVGLGQAGDGQRGHQQRDQQNDGEFLHVQHPPDFQVVLYVQTPKGVRRGRGVRSVELGVRSLRMQGEPQFLIPHSQRLTARPITGSPASCAC